MSPVHDAAAVLRARGFALCKPDPREKKPTYPKWGTCSKEPGDFGAGDMLGILAGPLSDGGKPDHALVIVDLDSSAAIRRADEYLPATAMADGRASKPRAHRYYLVPLDSIPHWAFSSAPQAAAAAKEKAGHVGPFLKHFALRETGKGVLDFIGTGGQVVCPPSMHESGEAREWAGGAPGEPAVVPFLELWQAACELAAACGCEIPDVVPRPPKGRAARPATPILERAAKYLAKCEPSVSGAGGHKRAFSAARVVVYGFDLGPEVGFELLRDHWNGRCSPPWSEKELQHKCEDADRVPYKHPRGWLRSAEQPERNGRTGHDGAHATVGVPGPPAAALVSRKLSDVEPQSVSWVWPGWIPAGMLSILDGDPGEAKSTITVSVAAFLTRGRAMPFREKPTAPRSGVLFLAAEDSAEHTICPRAEAATADLELCRVSECIRIGESERPIRLPDDIQALEREIVAHKIGLVVIDPFLGFLSQAIDSHKDQSVRDVLHQLKLVAGRTGAAILALRHLNKGGAGNPLYRGGGSIAITASARSAFTVSKHPTDPDLRVMASTKLNVGKPPRSIVYQVEDYAGYPVIVWVEECDLTAADLGATAHTRDGGALDRAQDFLREALAGGPRAESDVQRDAEARGINDASVRRARKALGVISRRSAFAGGRWELRLPAAEGVQTRGHPEGVQPEPDR